MGGRVIRLEAEGSAVFGDGALQVSFLLKRNSSSVVIEDFLRRGGTAELW
jgi:hypothetical protein